MFNLPFFKSSGNITPTVLIVLDGFGIAPASHGNAITSAKASYISKLSSVYPHGELIASGESVGLPANEVGNTEVGHLTIGAGRVILQDLKRINLAVEDGTFFNNKALLQASGHVKRHNSQLHIASLVSSGNVHSSLEHLYAVMEFCRREELHNVYYHLFTDGRDAPPQEGAEIIRRIQEKILSLRIGAIATISGRYFAMDRDRRWDRTQKAYDALVLGRGVTANSPTEAMSQAYAKGQTDEFVEPTVILTGGQPHFVNDNDAFIFVNFRIDRPKQLAMAFLLNDLEKLKVFDFGYDPASNKHDDKAQVGATFKREKVPTNLFFVTMTQYHKNLPVSAIAFAPEEVTNSLPVVLANKNLLQLHMAESEKQRFVTYYFDGNRENLQTGEEVQIIPSPHVATYDKKPEMSLPKLAKEFAKQVKKRKYHFIVINIANPDMVAHTGNLEATVKAIQYVDIYLEEMLKAVVNVGGTVFITADHGNAEELLTFPSTSFFYTSSQGVVNTDHSNNPVPFIVVAKKYEGKPIQLPQGALCDVSPTVLGSMGIPKPPEMVGKDLLQGVM